MPMGAAQGMSSWQPALKKALGHAQILGAIGEDLEAVAAERACRFDEPEHVGLQRVVVGDHLKLDPIRLEQLARHLRRRDRLARRVAAGRIRQDAGPRPFTSSQKRCAAASRAAFAAEGNRQHGRAWPLRRRGAGYRARDKARCRAGAATPGARHKAVRLVAVFAAHAHPPCRGDRTSMASPSARLTVARALRRHELAIPRRRDLRFRRKAKLAAQFAERARFRRCGLRRSP